MNKYSKKVRNAGLGLLLTFFAFGCYEEIPAHPPPLNKTEMQALLKDIHKAESLIAEGKSAAEKDSLAQLYYAYVLHIHKIDGKTLDSTINAYFRRPEELKAMYSNIIKDIDKEMQADKQK